MKIIKCSIAVVLTMMSVFQLAAQEKREETLPFQHHQIERYYTTLSEGVVAFVGYSSSNFGVIRTKHGYILIDTGDDLNGVKDAISQIDTLAPGVLQAIILTHSHPDHRGGAYRDVERWVKGVRRLLDFDAKAVMCGHNLVLKDEQVRTVLTDYADAMEYVYNKTTEGMNAGKSPKELAAEITLPARLKNKPYLAEFYGAVSWAVKSIYVARLGWFDGNPSNLFPLTIPQEAERMARLAGGTKLLMTAARMALKDKDYQWAMQLADYLIALNVEKEGRSIKASAMRGLSKTVLPISGKNYLMQSALETSNK